jgi:chromatin structure-remodeling complex subunit RSC9
VAADFIKNVSNTFSGATAQVIQGPNPKFIIRGICARNIPMHPNGQLYRSCLWSNASHNSRSECGQYLLTAKDIWDHVLRDHLHAPADSEGHLQFRKDVSSPLLCCWAGCGRTFGPSPNALFDIGMHVKTHLSDNTPSSTEVVDSKSSKSARQIVQAAEYSTHSFLNTTVDERGDAAGLPLAAVLVLRNLARNLPRTEPAEVQEESWIAKLFAPVKPQLWFVMAFSKPLAGYIADLTNVIEKRA